MDIQRLKAFRSVVTSGSVRAAATALDYSPASISQQVSQLQRDTGLALVSRVGRGLEPTPVGLALADRIDHFLDELADLEGFIDGLRDGRLTTFTLCYFSSLGSAWMPRILATLATEFPEVRVDLQVRDGYDATARPRPDIQLVAQAARSAPPEGYDAVAVVDDPYLVALPVGHPLASEPSPLPVATLRREPWVDTNAGHGSCRQITLDACAAAGFRPDLHVQAQDYTTALALVAADIGVAVVPALGALSPPDGVRLRPLTQPTPHREITALVATGVVHQAVAVRALELIRQAAHETGEVTT